MAIFNLRMQNFRKIAEKIGLGIYMWPYWFSYQNKRFKESYWPAYTNSDNKKNIFISIGELLLLTIYWRCLPHHYFRYGLYNKEFSWKNILNYIPETVVYYKILPKINSNYILLDNKNITEEILRANNIPIPRTLIKIRSSQIFDNNGKYLKSKDELKDYLNRTDIEKIIAKPADCGSGGKDIFFLNKAEIDYKNLIRTFKGDWIFQEILENDGLIKEMYPHALNSFRVITLFTSSGPKVLYAILKLGNNHAKTDNAHTGGIYIGVNIQTGRIMSKAFNEDLLEFDEHPLTHFKFKNQKILGFNEVLEQAKRAARIFPEIKFIGWDIAITRHGPVVLEGNSSSGLTIIQRTHGGMSKFYNLANDIIRNK